MPPMVSQGMGPQPTQPMNAQGASSLPGVPHMPPATVEANSQGQPVIKQGGYMIPG